MIEILNLIFLNFLIIFLLLNSLNLIIFNKNKLGNILIKNSIYDIMLIGTVPIFYIFLIFSFLNIDSKYVIIFLAFFLFLNLFFFKKKFFFTYKPKNLYFFIFLLLCISSSIELASNVKLEWDGLAHWFFKYKIFFYDENISRITEFFQPHYPHLGVYIWSILSKISFLNYEYTGRVILSILYSTSILSLMSYLESKISIYTKLFFILFLYFFLKDLYLFGGYQEYFSFVYILLSSKFFFLESKNDNKIIILIFFLVSNLLLWFKQEGIIFFIIINFLYVCYKIHNPKYKISYFLILVLNLFLFLNIKKLLLGVSATNSITTNISEIILNVDILKFIPFLLKNIIIVFFQYPLFLIIIFLFMIKFSLKSKILKIYFLFFLLNIATLFAIYLTAKSPNIYYDIPLTIDRFLFQSLGFYLPYVMYEINKIFYQK